MLTVCGVSNNMLHKATHHIKGVIMKLVRLLFLVIFAASLLSAWGIAQTSAVKMNEIYSRGTTAAPDWIELHNGSNGQVDISGYKIYDNGGESGSKPKMTFPSGTVIPAKGFFVIVTDISTSVDPSGFGLSSTGEKVWLENASGSIIDSVTFPAMDTSQTYGRLPDGGSWGLRTPISRGLSNSLVLMNEIYSRGTTADPDWIELYNTTTALLNIAGYKIYDNGGQGGTKPKMTFAAGTTIPAKGFYVVVTDISTTIDPSGFGLSSGGETVWLENAAGAIIDSITFAAMDTSQSYGRLGDGGAWQLLNRRTRGTSNGSLTAIDDQPPVAATYALFQNYPNPFNPSTAIAFEIPRREYVVLSVYNTMGQLVRTLLNTERPAGSHTVLWNGRDNQSREVASGVYFYELVTGSYSKTAKMLLLR